MARKKKLDQLRSAEEKFQTLVDKRNELNEQASAVRADRDALNDKKKEHIIDLENIRGDRRDLSKRIGELKAERDEFQKKAKSMIDMKRKLRSGFRRNARDDLDSKKSEATRLEMQQQIVALTLEKEAELIKKIRALYDQIAELETTVNDQDRVKLSIEEIDQAIDESFSVADSKHKNMITLVEERKILDDKIKKIVNDIGVIAASANKKHDEFLKIKKAADQYHVKAKELREKILEIRAERRKERQEQAIAIKEQNEAVQRELLDKEKLDQAADETLQKLLTKGKIEF